jgi:hypothetical protein
LPPPTKSSKMTGRPLETGRHRHCAPRLPSRWACSFFFVPARRLGAVMVPTTLPLHGSWILSTLLFRDGCLPPSSRKLPLTRLALCCCSDYFWPSLGNRETRKAIVRISQAMGTFLKRGPSLCGATWVIVPESGFHATQVGQQLWSLTRMLIRGSVRRILTGLDPAPEFQFSSTENLVPRFLVTAQRAHRTSERQVGGVGSLAVQTLACPANPASLVVLWREENCRLLTILFRLLLVETGNRLLI